jgi:hypothetical protein
MPSTALNSRVLAACALLASACGSDPEVTDSTSSPDPLIDTPQLGALTPSLPPETDSSAAGLCDNYQDPNAIPFATALFPISDACPNPRERVAPLPSSTIVNVTQDQPGEICVSGRVTDGWVNLIVSLDRINDIFSSTPPPETRQPLNTAALGIAALRFTLDPAPANGLHVALSQVVGENCTVTSRDCIVAGFYVMAEGRPGVLFDFDQPGSQTLTIADFQRAPWVDPTLELDTTKISGVEFELNAGDFAFCLRDFDFLDQSGNPVARTRE